MSRTRRRTTALLVALAAGALGLTGCVVMPEEPQPPAPCSALASHPLPQCAQPPGLASTSVTFSQAQAVPDFDGGSYVVTDPAALHDLDDALGSATTDVTITGECDGGRTTELVIDSATQGIVTVVVDTCTDDPLAAELDDLVEQWHASGVAVPAP